MGRHASGVPTRRAGAGRRAQAGFTLVEVLVASAIAALLAAALMHIFSGVLDLTDVAREAIDSRRDASLAVSLLNDDIRQAERILTLAPGSLELLSAEGDTIRYAWRLSVPDTLWRAAGAESPAPVAAGIDSLILSLHTVSRPFTEELDQPVSVEGIVVRFAPGDWDEWVAWTDCSYESRDDKRIKDKEWRAEEFWPQESFYAFSRAGVRVKAKEKFPPDVDLLVRIYRADPLPPQYPQTLVAEGRISLLAIGQAYDWEEATLTMTGQTPILAGEHYWILFRPDGLGAATYAAHAEQERVKDCDDGEWPGTDIYYRETADAGKTWSSRTDRREIFFCVSGVRTETKLAEITLSLADTLGVSYSLKMAGQEGSQRRAGFISRYDS
ncbi:MAG: prepilin-type N-terminal cleavage/methylation domain-containing protein [Candidatus Eisenbacteria bacterium]